MAIIRAALTAAILAGPLCGCGLVEGLSQFSKEDCSLGCDDASGATSPDASREGATRGGDDSAASGDTGAPGDADAGWTTSDDGSSGDDAPAPEGDDSGAADAAVDARGDGASGVDAAGVDSGCGPLTSVDNCGACGVACDKLTGTPSCTGATCTYACTTGHSDCNAAAAPDTDGCECATPGCCATGCQTTHGDGLGHSYYDCNPLSTFTEPTAISACTAYALSNGGTAADCSGGWKCNGSTVQNVCYSTNGKTCGTYCWVYMDGGATQAPGTLEDCSCPANKDGTWN